MTILVEIYYILVWEQFGCQLHSNEVVASVTKDFYVCDSIEAVLGCHIGVTLITYYPKIKTVSCQLTYHTR